jgi:O-antigen/teichoic acid export membrane protein
MDAARKQLVRFLRWTERYTKTDMVFLARGGFFSILLQTASVLTSLVLAIAVSHVLPKDVYGLYKYIISIVTLISLLSLNSIGSAVFQSAAEGYDGALKRGFWENIKWSALIFVCTLGLALYYFTAHNSTLAIGILIGGMFAPFLASASLFGSFLGGKRDYYRQTIYGITDTIIPTLFLIVIIFFTQSPIVLVATYFIANTAAAYFFYRRTLAIYHANMHLHDAKLVSYSKHLSVMGIVNGIALNIDQVLLFHFVGAAQLAIYNFATAIPDQVRGPSKMLDSMIQAQFTRRTASEIQSGMKNKILWYAAACVSITVAYIAIAPLFFHLLFPQYEEAIFYTQVYGLWILTLAFDPFFDYLASRRLVREQYIVFGSYSAVQIVAQVAGAVYWGLIGVIVARLIARVYMMVLPYFLYRKAIENEVARSNVAVNVR